MVRRRHGRKVFRITMPAISRWSPPGKSWALSKTILIGLRQIFRRNPFTLRFQGKGVVDGEEWIYDYVGYVIRPWPNGADQRMAMVGSIVRTIPHSSGNGGTAPAGVVCSWIAVRQDDSAT